LKKDEIGSNGVFGGGRKDLLFSLAERLEDDVF